MGGICRVWSATKSLPMEMSLIITLLLKTESTFSPPKICRVVVIFQKILSAGCLYKLYFMFLANIIVAR